MGPNWPLIRRPDLDRWQVHYSLTHPASNWREVFEWCCRTFGHPDRDPDTGQYNAWSYQGGWIYFYDAKCVTLYQLRWA